MVTTTAAGEARSVGQQGTTPKNEPTLTGAYLTECESSVLIPLLKQNPGHSGPGVHLPIVLGLRRPDQRLHHLRDRHPQ